MTATTFVHAATKYTQLDEETKRSHSIIQQYTRQNCLYNTNSATTTVTASGRQLGRTHANSYAIDSYQRLRHSLRLTKLRRTTNRGGETTAPADHVMSEAVI